MTDNNTANSSAGSGKRYNVSEFSKLCGIPKDTLLYYDRIDLVKPSRNPQNGYRTYSFDQLFEISFLQQLKATGTPLANIKQFQCSPSISRLDAIVCESQTRLDAQLANLLQAQEALQASKILIDDFQTHPTDQLFFKEIPARRYVASADPFSVDDDGMRFPVQLYRLMEQCTQNGTTFRKLMSEALFPEAFQEKRWHESRATLRIFSGPHAEGELEAPAGTYASFNTVRSYRQVPETYRQIARLLDQEGLRAQGPLFQTAVSPVRGLGQPFPMHFTVLAEG